jgi:hypothetical protein
MNKLQLVNRLRMEVGSSAPVVSSTVNQSGEIARLVGWIDSAHLDVESEHQDWQWMRKSASLTTVAGQAQYAIGTDILITDFGKWSEATFRNYVTSVGLSSEIFMTPVDYDTYRDSYQYGALRLTQSRPLEFAIGPGKQVCLGPVPAAGYTVTGDYFRAPRELSGDTDTPDMPTQYHMAIVYRAMMMYGRYESAPEVISDGEANYRRILGLLSIDRLPQVVFGGALA